MSYDSVAHFVKMGGTIAFFALFLGVLIYTFWPGNKDTFERAAHRPLDDNRPLSEETDR